MKMIDGMCYEECMKVETYQRENDGKQDGEGFFDKDGNVRRFFEDGKETTRKLPSLLND